MSDYIPEFFSSQTKMIVSIRHIIGPYSLFLQYTHLAI